MYNVWMESNAETVPQPRRSVVLEILKFTILSLLIVTPFRFFVAQPFIVSGASMEPTFDPKEYLVIDQLSYRFEKPERGDVVIFRYPLDPGTFFIKRVIGLPGETIESDGASISIVTEGGTREEVLKEPYLMDAPPRREAFTVTLNNDEYFVLGDNRNASSDSRTWGPLNERFIVGRAAVRLFPVQVAELFPGKFSFSEE